MCYLALKCKSYKTLTILQFDTRVIFDLLIQKQPFLYGCFFCTFKSENPRFIKRRAEFK